MLVNTIQVCDGESFKPAASSTTMLENLKRRSSAFDLFQPKKHVTGTSQIITCMRKWTKLTLRPKYNWDGVPKGSACFNTQGSRVRRATWLALGG